MRVMGRPSDVLDAAQQGQVQHVALRVAAAERAGERAQIRQQPDRGGVVAAIECHERPAGREAELPRGPSVARGKRLPCGQHANQAPGTRVVT